MHVVLYVWLCHYGSCKVLSWHSNRKLYCIRAGQSGLANKPKRAELEPLWKKQWPKVQNNKVDSGEVNRKVLKHTHRERNLRHQVVIQCPLPKTSLQPYRSLIILSLLASLIPPSSFSFITKFAQDSHVCNTWANSLSHEPPIMARH